MVFLVEVVARIYSLFLCFVGTLTAMLRFLFLAKSLPQNVSFLFFWTLSHVDSELRGQSRNDKSI